MEFSDQVMATLQRCRQTEVVLRRIQERAHITAGCLAASEDAIKQSTSILKQFASKAYVLPR